MKKKAKRRRTKEKVQEDKDNARKQEALIQAKLAKYDELEEKYRSMAK